MKVCTDACVLGVYADVQGDRLLDIGTGTGLLALMAAQRNPTARIDAVEIDKAATTQAAENAVGSPFADRVRVVQSRIQTYQPGLLYDRILTNPPFYTNHLPSPNAAVNRALHTGDLPFAELVAAVVRLLRKDGQWWVLLPPNEAGQLDLLAESVGLQPVRRLQLRHHAGKPVFRVITGYRFVDAEPVTETLDIYEPDGRTYTDDFRSLLQPFYLIF